jgi:positive regulator of sigma E activity
MPVRTGRIEARRGRTWLIRLDPHDGCGGCQVAGSCWGGLLVGSARPMRRMVCEPPAAGPLPPGTSVRILLQESLLLRAACLAYGTPLLAGLGGSWAGAALWPHGGDAGAVAGFVAGLALAAAVLRRADRRNGRSLLPALERHEPPRVAAADYP